MASPVMEGMLSCSKRRQRRRKAISIRGVPHDAVRVFLRFLYSSWYYISFSIFIMHNNCEMKLIMLIKFTYLLILLLIIYLFSYEQEEMNHFILHLVVLSHVFMVPSLKKLCVQALEKGLLSVDNVVDVLQLSRLCDAPRLNVLCQSMILKDFEVVSATEGWKVLKQSNPTIVREIIDLVEVRLCIFYHYSK